MINNKMYYTSILYIANIRRILNINKKLTI
nr:MAG TPA: hypothetical protein [Crassvirales sp.]